MAHSVVGLFFFSPAASRVTGCLVLSDSATAPAPYRRILRTNAKDDVAASPVTIAMSSPVRMSRKALPFGIGFGPDNRENVEGSFKMISTRASE